jgi:hypothetical protein
VKPLGIVPEDFVNQLSKGKFEEFQRGQQEDATGYFRVRRDVAQSCGGRECFMCKIFAGTSEVS